MTDNQTEMELFVAVASHSWLYVQEIPFMSWLGVALLRRQLLCRELGLASASQGSHSRFSAFGLARLLPAEDARVGAASEPEASEQGSILFGTSWQSRLAFNHNALFLLSFCCHFLPCTMLCDMLFLEIRIIWGLTQGSALRLVIALNTYQSMLHVVGSTNSVVNSCFIWKLVIRNWSW